VSGIDQEQRRFLSVRQLTERWACSRQTIERLSREDPRFPSFYKIGTNKRTVRVDEVEAYERGMVVARGGVVR
jgi:predicted DNA-binding transcriptional regulator AlpA